MSQLSLFSAEARPAALTDLAGLLCGPGQIVRFGAGDQARLSIVLADADRAPAARVALAAAGVTAQAVVTESGATALRTAEAGRWQPGAPRRCAADQRHQTHGTLGRNGGARTRPDARRHVAAIPRPHGVLNRAP